MTTFDTTGDEIKDHSIPFMLVLMVQDPHCIKTFYGRNSLMYVIS